MKYSFYACLATSAMATFSSQAISASNRGGAADQPVQTKVVASHKCLLTSKDGAVQGQNLIPFLAGIFVPILTEFVIDAVTADLKKVRTVKSAGEWDYYLFKTETTLDQNGSVIDSQPTKLPQAMQPECITVITGKMADNEGEYLSHDIKTDTSVPPGAPEAVIIKRLTDNGIQVSGPLSSIFEFKLIRAEDNSAFKYTPQFYKSFNLLPGNRAKTQGVVYNLTLSGAGQSPNGTVFSLAAINVGPVSAGTEFHIENTDSKQKKKIEAMQTGWLQMPGMSKGSYYHYLSNLVTGKDKDKSYMPVTFKAQIVQTKKPSDAAVFIANLLEKAKPKLAEAAGGAFEKESPFATSQAKLDADIAVAAAQVELDTATTEGNSAKINLATLKLQKAKEALKEINGN